jgi:hypothetical protein
LTSSLLQMMPLLLSMNWISTTLLQSWLSWQQKPSHRKLETARIWYAIQLPIMRVPFPPSYPLLGISASQRLLPTHLCSAQVLSLAGELLHNAESLLQDGLHCADVVEGYEQACQKVETCVWHLLLPGHTIPEQLLTRWCRHWKHWRA